MPTGLKKKKKKKGWWLCAASNDDVMMISDDPHEERDESGSANGGAAHAGDDHPRGSSRVRRKSGGSVGRSFFSPLFDLIDYTETKDAKATMYPLVKDGGTVPPAVTADLEHWGSLHGQLDCLFAKEADRTNLPVGVLELDIIEAFGLPASDIGGYSDPYCVATLTGYWSHGQEWVQELRSRFKTEVKSTTLFPVWKASCRFYVPRAGAILRLEVFDHDTLDEDDRLGYVEVPLEALLSGAATAHWLRLKLHPDFGKKIKEHKAAELLKGAQHKGHPRSPSISRSFREARQDSGAQEEDQHDESLWPSESGHEAQHGRHENSMKGKLCKLGDHACIHVAMRFHYSPVGVALTGLYWPEAAYEYIPTKFELNRTVTQIFILLRDLGPIIEFFTSEDQTGLVDGWSWLKPWRSAFWFLALWLLYKHNGYAIWSFFQAYLVYISWRARRLRRSQLLNYRKSVALRRELGLPTSMGNDKSLPPEVCAENGIVVDPLAPPPQHPDETESLGGAPPKRTLAHRHVPHKRWELLEAEIDAALARPSPEPAFWGRPPAHDSSGKHGRYESIVPVFYDSDDEHERDFNWMPADDFEDCKFELPPSLTFLVDQLIGLIRAPWMDTTENVIIRINAFLDPIFKLLDWRNPTLAKTMALVFGASAVLHLWVPFHLFFWALHVFLFTWWTPALAVGLKVLLAPYQLPARLLDLRGQRRTAALDQSGGEARTGAHQSGDGGKALERRPSFKQGRAPPPVANAPPVHPLLAKLLVPTAHKDRINYRFDKSKQRSGSFADGRSASPGKGFRFKSWKENWKGGKGD